MRILRTSRSVGRIREELKKQGFNVSHELARQILRSQRFD
jgi:uncharacterized protein (DUF302 family)